MTPNEITRLWVIVFAIIAVVVIIGSFMLLRLCE